MTERSTGKQRHTQQTTHLSQGNVTQSEASSTEDTDTQTAMKTHRQTDTHTSCKKELVQEWQDMRTGMRRSCLFLTSAVIFRGNNLELSV